MESVIPVPKSEFVLARLGKELSASSNAIAAAEIILAAANELLGWDAADLILYDPEQGGSPRPLLAIDTIDGKQVIHYDMFPSRPTENMLKAIRQDGFLSLYDTTFELSPSWSFGDRRKRSLSQMFVPVRSGSRTIGTLSIQSRKRHAYDHHTLQIFKDFANHCAGALERIWAQEALNQLANRVMLLYQTTHAISASLDMEELCHAIFSTVQKVMPCDDFVIDGYNPDTNQILSIFAIEHPGNRVYAESHSAGHGLAGHIVQSREALLFNNKNEIAASGIETENYGKDPDTDPAHSILAVPMILKGRLTGMISAQAHREDAYTTEDKHLLEMLASHAAAALENARIFSTIQTLADIDSLTGVLTRRKFIELLDNEFSRAKRYNHFFSLLMLDVDGFKKINDQYGHQAGDIVLKKVVSICASSLRKVDIFGRLGGDEFAVVMPCTHLGQAVRAANRLRKLVEETNLVELFDRVNVETSQKVDKEHNRVTVSIGVAMCDETCPNIDVLMDHADRALYFVKCEGRNQIHIWKKGT